MSGLIRVIRNEPNLITGVFTAAFNALALFSVIDWTDDQMAAMNILLGAVMVLVRQIVTPTSPRP